MPGPPTSRARRRAAAVATALLAHALIFAGLSLTHALPEPPDLRPMEVLLVPPPFRPQHAPQPPRQAAQAPSDARASPSPAPRPHAPPTPPQAALGDWRVKPEPGGAQEPARKSLRALIGCESKDLLALTPQERQACADKLAAGVRDAPLYAVVSPKLKKQFDGEYVCPEGDVWCEYRMGKAPFPGLFAPHGRPKKYREWD
ncbi:hypothetical protein [Phenylobacterium aquaticum]|uniref:hypothetical protein n=1 Tax=Phenylobacterium aquaticum TaxID=1763816 RepID=UPI001F5C7185|nr:hypothetical protein [Phenylobacterium aquaticum]MCI3132303.1 hypothetical protein [Phenylobacterium aquaticum]